MVTVVKDDIYNQCCWLITCYLLEFERNHNYGPLFFELVAWALNNVVCPFCLTDLYSFCKLAQILFGFPRTSFKNFKISMNSLSITSALSLSTSILLLQILSLPLFFSYSFSPFLSITIFSHSSFYLFQCLCQSQICNFREQIE